MLSIELLCPRSTLQIFESLVQSLLMSWTIDMDFGHVELFCHIFRYHNLCFSVLLILTIFPPSLNPLMTSWNPSTIFQIIQQPAACNSEIVSCWHIAKKLRAILWIGVGGATYGQSHLEVRSASYYSPRSASIPWHPPSCSKCVKNDTWEFMSHSLLGLT